jgi:hypothetical protein
VSQKAGPDGGSAASQGDSAADVKTDSAQTAEASAGNSPAAPVDPEMAKWIAESEAEAERDFELAPWRFYMRVIKRILYVFASANPGFKYLQGFNELVSVCYIILFRAKVLWNNDLFCVEALSFYLF